MAKNLVDENDNHLENENRFYLFVSPSPMNGKQNLALHEADADILQLGKRLYDVYTGQSTFRDWIQAQTINQQIKVLDQRAKALADALKRDQVNPAVLAEASQQVLTLLYSTGASGETQAQALHRLCSVRGGDRKSWRGGWIGRIRHCKSHSVPLRDSRSGKGR